MTRDLSRPVLTTLLAVAAACATGGCLGPSPSAGGGQTDFAPPRRARPLDVLLPEGYQIEVVASGLTFPCGITFDDQGRAYVVESGYSYGEVWTTPRLLRLEPGGGYTSVAEGEHGDGPWTGADWHDGAFYIADARTGKPGGGRILRVTEEGGVTVLVDGLPSLGDHHTNGPLVGPDGWVYFGQGIATNSGVVGTDNAEFGWLKRQPDFCDIPAEDVTLTGENFTTGNPLTPRKRDEATTGAYLPFGTPTEPGQVILGRVPCTGAVMRVASEGGALEVVAWGMRNPYGLAWSPDGTLYVTENSYDERGSRPVWGAGDVLWAVDTQAERPTWYGWPDFHGARPLEDSHHFTPKGKPAPRFLLAEHPNDPPNPSAVLGVHSSSNGLDFSRSDTFGHAGDAFVAQFGDMAPKVGAVAAPVGFKVVRVEVDTGVVHDFAANGSGPGPATKLHNDGLERPTAVRFDASGEALYVVDFGVVTMSKAGPHPRQGTGVVWRITREDGQ